MLKNLWLRIKWFFSKKDADRVRNIKDSLNFKKKYKNYSRAEKRRYNKAVSKIKGGDQFVVWLNS